MELPENYHDIERINARKDNALRLWDYLLELLKARRTRLEMSLQLQHNFQEMLYILDNMEELELRVAERDKGLHALFKLQSTMSTTSMVLFDHLGCLKKYETVEEILREFFDLRMKMYDKRKKFMVGMLQSEAGKLSNQARFILEKCDGTLKVKLKTQMSDIQY